MKTHGPIAALAQVGDLFDPLVHLPGSKLDLFGLLHEAECGQNRASQTLWLHRHLCSSITKKKRKIKGQTSYPKMGPVPFLRDVFAFPHGKALVLLRTVSQEFL